MDVGLGVELTGSRDRREYGRLGNPFFGSIVKNNGRKGKYKYSPSPMLSSIMQDTLSHAADDVLLKDLDMKEDEESIYFTHNDEQYKIVQENPTKNPSSGFFSSMGEKKTCKYQVVSSYQTSDKNALLAAWQTMRKDFYADDSYGSYTKSASYLFELYPVVFIKKDFDFLESEIGGRRFDASDVWAMASLSFGARGCKLLKARVKKSQNSIPHKIPPIFYQNSPIVLGISLGYKIFGLIVETKIIELVSSCSDDKTNISPAVKFGICIVTKYFFIKIGWDFEHKSVFVSITLAYSIDVMNGWRIPKQDRELQITKNPKIQRMSQYTAY